MNHILEIALLSNGLIGLVTHVWVIARWVRRKGLSVERKAEIRLHTRKHGGKLKDCAECEALSLASQRVGQH